MPYINNPRVSVVIPARNESRNLEVILPTVAAVRPAVHEVIVVDGCSVDGTIETAQAVLPWVKVITQTRRGKGNALASGFAAATGDIIVTFDPDGSSDPVEIPRFVEALVAGADFVTGSHFVRRGDSDRIGMLRRAAHIGLNAIANALFGTSHTDLCYGYHAFWANLLPALELPPISAPRPPVGMYWGDGFEIEIVLSCRVAAAGMRIIEVPSVQRERTFSQTNLWTFSAGGRVLRALAVEHRRAVRRRAERAQDKQQQEHSVSHGWYQIADNGPGEQTSTVTTVTAVLDNPDLDTSGLNSLQIWNIDQLDFDTPDPVDVRFELSLASACCLKLALAFLPRRERIRYNEEFRSELVEYTGADQIVCALRQIRMSFSDLRKILR